MTPEEVAKKHCYNGHNPEMCSLLADVRNLLSEEREQAASYLESAARACGELAVAPKVITDLAAAIRSGVQASVTKG